MFFHSQQCWWQVSEHENLLKIENSKNHKNEDKKMCSICAESFTYKYFLGIELIFAEFEQRISL